MSNNKASVSILSALLSLILAAVLTFAVLVTVVATLIKEENTELIAERVFEDLKADDLAISTSAGKKSVASALLYMISDCPGADKITEKQMASTLAPKFLETFTDELLEEFYDPSVTDVLDVGIRPSGIYRFFEKNQKTLNSLASSSGYVSSVNVEGCKDQILDRISELFGKDGVTVDNLIADGFFKDNLNSAVDATRALLDIKAILVAFGAAAFICVLILVVNFGNPGKFLSACGTPAFITGLIYFLGALAIRYFVLSGKLHTDGIGDYVAFTIGYSASVTMDVSVIVLAVGFVLVILGAVVKKLLK